MPQVEVKMDSASNSSDGQRKHPPGSFLNMLSNVFNRDRPAEPAVTQTAVLTAYRTLPGVESVLAEGDQSSTDVIGNDRLKGGGDNDNVESWEMESCKESNNRVKAVTTVDPDLVQVTMVETYSDTETEDEEGALGNHSQSEKHVPAQEPLLPEEDSRTVSHGDGDGDGHAGQLPSPGPVRDAIEAEADYQVPVFRANSLLERSLKDTSVLYARSTSRTISKPDPALLLSISEQREKGCGPEENAAPRTVDLETVGAEASSDEKAAMSSSSLDVGIDLSNSSSVPSPLNHSIASGIQTSAATVDDTAAASPSGEAEEPDKGQADEAPGQESKERSEEPPPRQVSPSPPSNLRSPKASDQTSPSPEEQSDTTDEAKNLSEPGPAMSLSCVPGESPAVILPSTIPASPKSLHQMPATRTPDAKTPDAKAPSPATPSSPSLPTSATTSPSMSMTLSSAPSFQLPALFSGMRVLRKGVVGEDRETLAEIKQKDTDLALLNLKKTVNKAKLFPEQITTSPAKKRVEPKPVAGTKSDVLGQLGQDPPLEPKENKEKEPDSVEEGVMEKAQAPDSTPSSAAGRRKASDIAYETLKNLFGPKTVKKETTESMDLEAVKKKNKNDKELLRSIFERTPKSPGSEVKSPTEAKVCCHYSHSNNCTTLCLPDSTTQLS